MIFATEETFRESKFMTESQQKIIGNKKRYTLSSWVKTAKGVTQSDTGWQLEV